MFLFCNAGISEDSIAELEDAMKNTEAQCFNPEEAKFVTDARKDFHISFRYEKGLIITEYKRERPYYLRNVVRFKGQFISMIDYEEECAFELNI